MYFLAVHHSTHGTDMEAESHTLIIDGPVLRLQFFLPLCQCTWYSSQDFVGYSDLCVTKVLTDKISPCSLLDSVYEYLVADGKPVSYTHLKK